MRTRRIATVLLAGFLGLGACGDDQPEGEVRPEPVAEPAAGGGGEPEGEEREGAAGGAEAGPVVDDATYELRLEASGPYRAGELAQFAVRLTPKTGWHVNQEYPISVTVRAPSGVTLPKSELARADAAEFGEERARFDVPFTASAAGEHRVECEVDFAVCTDENCVPDERTLALVLPVE